MNWLSTGSRQKGRVWSFLAGFYHVQVLKTFNPIETLKIQQTPENAKKIEKQTWPNSTQAI